MPYRTALLKDARKRKGWTLAETAAYSGLSVSAVSRTERGRTASIKAVRKLAAALDVPLDAIYEAETGDTPSEEAPCHTG